MNHYVSKSLRRLVSTRAEHLREYCLIDIADTFFGGEVDHIVNVKHGGVTAAEILVYTCQPCKRCKDIAKVPDMEGHDAMRLTYPFPSTGP